jgi:hypothetical protein
MIKQNSVEGQASRIDERYLLISYYENNDVCIYHISLIDS